MYYAAFTIAAVLSGATLPFAGQERIDDGVNARIRDEGMNRSQVMRTLHYLADVYGPRVTGPPAAASTMRGILAPFQDLGIYGASASTGRTIGGTDSTSFNNAGCRASVSSRIPSSTTPTRITRTSTHTSA